MGVRNDCIFCKIVAGQIPCTKIYDDDLLLAFMDIAPLNRGHFLVIPKEHYENILQISPDLYGRLASVLASIGQAVQEVLSPEGMNIMQLNGKAGNQVVPHLHMHLVPRWTGDGLTICAWEPVMGDIKDISSVAEEIKSRLSFQR